MQNLPRLNCVAAQTVSAFAVDEYLQNHLLHAGVLFHLLLFVFNYDYTLDEGGVETSDETNLQEVANNLARLTIVSVGRLAGFKSKTYYVGISCLMLEIDMEKSDHGAPPIALFILLATCALVNN